MRFEPDWDRSGQVWLSVYHGKEETYTVTSSDRGDGPYLYRHRLMVTLSSGRIRYMETTEDLTPGLKFERGLEASRRKPFEQRFTWTRIS